MRPEPNIILIALPLIVPFSSHRSALLYLSGWGTVGFYSFLFARALGKLFPCLVLILVGYFLLLLWLLFRVLGNCESWVCLCTSRDSFACADTKGMFLPHPDPQRAKWVAPWLRWPQHPQNLNSPLLRCCGTTSNLQSHCKFLSFLSWFGTTYCLQFCLHCLYFFLMGWGRERKHSKCNHVPFTLFLSLVLC